MSQLDASPTAVPRVAERRPASRRKTIRLGRPRRVPQDERHQRLALDALGDLLAAYLEAKP